MLYFRFFKEKNNEHEAYNTRVFKQSIGQDVVYEIRHAAVDNAVMDIQEFEGATFNLTSGDYSGLMKLMNNNLEKAKVN